MSSPDWRAATDRVAADLGISLAELAVRLGYSGRGALNTARGAGAPAYMVAALRAVAANAPALPEEGV